MDRANDLSLRRGLAVHAQSGIGPLTDCLVRVWPDVQSGTSRTDLLFFPMFVNVVAGLRSSRQELIELYTAFFCQPFFKSSGTSSSHRLFHLFLLVCRSHWCCPCWGQLSASLLPHKKD